MGNIFAKLIEKKAKIITNLGYDCLERIFDFFVLDSLLKYNTHVRLHAKKAEHITFVVKNSTKFILQRHQKCKEQLPPVLMSTNRNHHHNRMLPRPSRVSANHPPHNLTWHILPDHTLNDIIDIDDHNDQLFVCPSFLFFLLNQFYFWCVLDSSIFPIFSFNSWQIKKYWYETKLWWVFFSKFVFFFRFECSSNS